jgi:hypothetical protein
MPQECSRLQRTLVYRLLGLPPVSIFLYLLKCAMHV